MDAAGLRDCATYKVYAVDAAGNISGGSNDSVEIKN